MFVSFFEKNFHSKSVPQKRCLTACHLVDAVVGEVHEDIADAAAVVGVLVGGKAHQAVIVEVDAERVQARQQHVQPQIKLGPVDQVRPSNIPSRDSFTF